MRKLTLRDRHVRARTQEERDEVTAEIARLCDEDAEAVARFALEQVKEDREEIEAKKAATP